MKQYAEVEEAREQERRRQIELRDKRVQERLARIGDITHGKARSRQIDAEAAMLRDIEVKQKQAKLAENRKAKQSLERQAELRTFLANQVSARRQQQALERANQEAFIAQADKSRREALEVE